MSIIVIPEKGFVQTEDISVVSIPEPKFVNSDKFEFKIHVKNQTAPLIITDLSKDRIVQIHSNVIQAWKKTQDLIEC